MRADELTHFPFFKEDCGGRCCVIHADHYFVLRIEESDICNTRSWRNVNLLYEVKFYRRKPHRFLQQEKAKKAACCRGFVYIPRGQTQPLILMNELYFYVIEMIYEKKIVIFNKIWMSSSESFGSNVEKTAMQPLVALT
jgi:hypothetical protein